MPYGYQKGLRDKKLNVNNLKYVPFLIRNEAFGISRDKKELRRKLGLPEDKFTVVLAEGGYGIGKMAAICKKIVKLHIPVTVIPVCGKNEKLFNYFKTLQPTEEITFAPYMFTEKILELEAASDLFCGKSGNIIAEATFFGNPAIVTNCSTVIEWNIADHYINTVGSAMKQLDPEKTVEMIVKFAEDPALLEPYREAARKYHENFGSEKAADVLWEKITETYPELRN
jgi:UDP-N-acetylglucosamine:LPS N-acetylglucosamine transferase